MTAYHQEGVTDDEAYLRPADDPDADFDKVFNQLREEFGNALWPVFIPIKEPNGVIMADLMTMKCFRYLPNGERQEEEMTPSRLEIAEKYQEIFMEAVAQTNEEMLEKFGIDSVIFTKHGDLDYSVDFAEIGTYEAFYNMESDSEE